MKCIFCKIANGEAPSYKLFEDEHTIAFLDLAKDVYGHILVIPKKHFKNILDCDCETLAHVMATVKKISNHLIDNCGFQGVDILNANEECAQQSVFHLHFHIIPRKLNDGIDAWPSFTSCDTPLEEVQKKLMLK